MAQPVLTRALTRYNGGMSKGRKQRADAGAPAAPRRLSGQNVFLGAVVVGGALVLGYLALFADGARPPRAEPAVSNLTLKDIPFNGARAYEYLKQLCDIGPRPSGSEGMQRQQKLLLEHFRKLGGEAQLQKFDAAHPVDGSRVPMANLLVEWHPKRMQRVLLCAHYDTLPFPMLDPVDPRGRFVGANDGASGVAVLMELAHHMAEFESRFGVDFALWDGEEFIFHESHEYFRGSQYFAEQYRKRKGGPRYTWGVLLDMVGDKDMQIYQEGHSVSWRDTRPLVEAIWGTARRLGVREFIPKVKHTVRDDHLPLRNTGGIPTCNIIDFDYPAWHTRDDTPEQCSALSLAKVGWVVHEWLKSLK